MYWIDGGVGQADLLPLPGSLVGGGATGTGAYRELRWDRCANGSKAFGTGCLERLQQGKLPNLRSGEGSPMGATVPWRMFTLSPLLPLPHGGGGDSARGWIFLGEVDKIVGVSEVRFLSIGVQLIDERLPGEATATVGSCVAFEVSLGCAEEVLTVAAVSPSGTYLTREIRERHGRICEW